MARYGTTTTPLLAYSAGPPIVGEISLNLSAGREDYVVGMAFADQVGTVYVEQSMDGTNWDLSASYSIVASTGKGFKEDIYAPYVRVRYKNGGVNQGALRLYARLSSAGDS